MAHKAIIKHPSFPYYPPVIPELPSVVRWAQLPADVLPCIARCLRSPKDLATFGSLCRASRQVFSPVPFAAAARAESRADSGTALVSVAVDWAGLGAQEGQPGRGPVAQHVHPEVWQWHASRAASWLQLARGVQVRRQSLLAASARSIALVCPPVRQCNTYAVKRGHSCLHSLAHDFLRQLCT